MRKISMNSREEFVRDVALDCIDNMSLKDKESIIDDPCPIDYHFGYAMYIRNNYIHDRELPDWGFLVRPDDLSSEIMKCIISLLIPDEYKMDDEYLDMVYEDERFIDLRRKYKEKYDAYPANLVEKHRDKAACISSEKIMQKIDEDDNLSAEEIDILYDKLNDEREKMQKAVDNLVRNLSNLV